ncbi:hypothetical protein [Thermaurantiacus sp.]
MAETIRLSAIIGDVAALLAPAFARTREAPADVRAVLPSLVGPIAEELASFLDIDIMSHLVQAWATAKELKALAAPADPAELAHVTLKEHEVQLKLDPELKVTMGGVPVWQLPLRIILTATLQAAQLGVRGGAIESVTPGTIGLSGKVKWEDETLPLPLKTKEIEVPGTLKLTPPLPIPKGDR